MTISQWADEYRYLSPESSVEPGKWDTADYEFQREIMDAISDPTITEVVVMTGAQVGKTESAINNPVGYFISEDPCPILVVQPTLEMGETWSKDRLAPMIRDTPHLHGRVKDPKSRQSGNTVLHKSFPGGHITITGANSPTGLASRPIRVVLMDEVDKYPASAGSEGDPCNLAIARTKRFWNRKIVKVSTPTEMATSRIYASFLAGDQRRRYVACPACGHQQILVWAQVKWDKNTDGQHLPATARYECTSCNHGLDDVERWQASKSGRFIAEKPFNGIASFHLNELYAPNVALADIVTKFLQAKRAGTLQLKAFINTELGEPWAEDTQQMDPESLLARVENYGPAIPRGVLLLTAGVDVQDDRLVVEVKGWSRNECWSIDWRTFRGVPTSGSAVWQDLDNYLLKRWPTDYGPQMLITTAFIDMGGHYTSAVYDFCAPRASRRIYPCKGHSSAGKPVVEISKKPIEGCQLMLIGTDTTKGLIHAYLKNEMPGPGYWHFGPHNDADYFAQLTSETLSLAYRNGQYVHLWKSAKGVRNEALDCSVYATAALDHLNVDWDSVEQAVAAAVATHQQRQAPLTPARQQVPALPAPPPAPRPALPPAVASPLRRLIIQGIND